MLISCACVLYVYSVGTIPKTIMTRHHLHTPDFKYTYTLTKGYKHIEVNLDMRTDMPISYKVTSPTSGLACAIQHFYSFSLICVNADHFDNIVVCMQNYSKMETKTVFYVTVVV